MPGRAYPRIIGALRKPLRSPGGPDLHHRGTEVFDGLRGIAILMVLVYHTWLFSWLTPRLTLLGHPLPVDVVARTGYLGVELFFMISGFVLFYPHARHALGNATVPSLREFARRRFFKIVPSYVLALIATAIVSIPIVRSNPQLFGSVFNHVFFYQNFFDDKLGTANSVFWSLAIEVQFYLVFPVLAWAFERRPFLVAPAMVAVAVWYRYTVAGCCLQIEPVTRQLPAFLDVFACGMAAAYALVWLRERIAEPKRHEVFFTLVACAAAAAGFTLLLGADAVAYVPGGKERWLLEYRTLFALTGATFGVASALALGWWRRILANPVLVFLSVLSYNLYLWHALVLIWLWKHGIPPAATADPHDDPHWKLVYIACGWTASLSIAGAITYFVERPLLHGRRRRPFAFDWRSMRAPSIAPSETRT